MKEAASAPDLIAFTDEAGRRGYVRGLSAPTDKLVSLMASILIPAEHVDLMRSTFAPLFERFRAAAPPGATLHITEAFKRGNEAWRVVAESVRAEQFEIMKEHGVFLTYSARRLKITREMHELVERLKAEAQAQRRSEYVVQGWNRPSADQADDDVMIDLALMVDEFAEQQTRKRADFHFDQIDDPVKERYLVAIDRTRRVSHGEHHVDARHRRTGEKAQGKIEFNAVTSQRLDATHLGGIEVVGKINSLTFAADVVCNSLLRHLERLAPDAPLNEKSSLQGWELSDLTWVAPNDSMFDKI